MIHISNQTVKNRAMVCATRQEECTQQRGRRDQRGTSARAGGNAETSYPFSGRVIQPIRSGPSDH